MSAARAAAVAAGLLLAACQRIDPVSDALFQRMLLQPRYDPYEATPVFPDGGVMQRPPEGTVPRDSAEEGSPPVTMPLLVRGRNRFETFCAMCHGILGDGESVVAANMQLRPAPTLLDPRIRDAPPERIYRIVKEGYGLMPSYAAELPASDRWAVVAYLRALQLSQHAPIERLPERVRVELERAAP